MSSNFCHVLNRNNIKHHIRHYKCLWPVLLFVAVVMASCSKADDPVADTPQPQIIFLFSPGGLGDMSYNDCILEGVQRFKLEQPETDIYIYSPESLDEAEKIFSDWLVRPESNILVLFVLATSDIRQVSATFTTELRCDVFYLIGSLPHFTGRALMTGLTADLSV